MPSSGRGLRAYAAPFVSGAALSFAYPPFSVPGIAFLGLVPFLVWLDRPRRAREILRGGLAFAVPYMAWSVSGFFLLGRFTPAGFVTPIVMLVFFWATFFLFPIVVNVANHALRLPPALVAPWAWVVSEHARTFGDLGFPTVTLGYALADFPALAQHADLVGVYGISFWLVAINSAIAAAWRSRRTGRGRLAPVAVLALLVAAPAIYDPIRRARVEAEIAAAPTLEIAIVQPNVAQEQKWDRSKAEEIYRRVNRLVARAEEGAPDLVVGPEACFPVVQPEGAARMPEEIAPGRRPLLIGAVTGIGEAKPAPGTQGRARRYETHYNSAVLGSPDRTVLGRHDKQRLVPITEQIPYKEVLGFALPALRKQFGRFVPAESLHLLELPHAGGPVPFGVLICYETLFPELARRMETMGAELLVTISNDAWFGRSSFPFQQESFCVLRAIENRRAVVRSANTGVSMVVDPTGRKTVREGLFREAVLRASVPRMRTVTFFARFGDLLVYLSYLGTVAILALAWRRSRIRAGAP